MTLGPPTAGLITAAQAARLPDVEPPRTRTNRRSRTRSSRDEFPRPLRLLIFERDHWTCQLCGTQVVPVPGRPDSAIAGHVRAVWEGGRATADNARTECLRCSAKGGAAERVASGSAPWRPRRLARPDQVPQVW